MMTIRLLAVGDLHLGRRPGSLPEETGDAAAEALIAAAHPAAALDRLVRAAIAEGVHAVVFAGDVVEDEQDFFEAYSALRGAVERLTRAGVDVLAVAGNHDVQVLPALADELPDFRLLGRGGRWEVARLRGDDGVEALLHGYSFATRHVTTSPLDAVHFERQPGLPAIGLLHCDRDAPASSYAPVTTRALHEAGLDAFLLGHIHKPDALSLTAPIGYLGSVTPLRSTETGTRGPWLLTLDRSGLTGIEQWPIASLRWEDLDVPLDGVNSVEAGRSRLLEALQRLASALPRGRFDPPLLGVKLRFTGRTDHRAELADALANDRLDRLRLDRDVLVHIHSVQFDTRPAIDLERLAERRDPLGLLAGKLLALDTPPEADSRLRRALIADARAVLERADADQAWRRLQRISLSDAQVVASLRAALLSAIDALLRQSMEERA